MKIQYPISRIIGAIMIIASFAIFSFYNINDNQQHVNYMKFQLWCPKAFIFCFFISFGIVGLTRGFKPFYEAITILIEQSDEITQDRISKSISFLNHLIKASYSTGRIWLTIAIINGIYQYSKLYIYTPARCNPKITIMLYILTGYLYIICAISFIYKPLREILVLKYEEIE